MKSAEWVGPPKGKQYKYFVDMIGTYKRVVWRLKNYPKEYWIREDGFFGEGVEIHRIYIETQDLAIALWEKDVFCRPKNMKYGDKVKVLKLPDSYSNDADTVREEDKDTHGKTTREIFEMSLGKTFHVSNFHNYDVGIDVGEIVGLKPYMETIYFDYELLEVVKF